MGARLLMIVHPGHLGLVMLLTPGISMQANLPDIGPDGLPVCRFRGSKYRGNTASRAWVVNFNNGNCNNNDIDNNNNYVRAVR